MGSVKNTLRIRLAFVCIVALTALQVSACDDDETNPPATNDAQDLADVPDAEIDEDTADTEIEEDVENDGTPDSDATEDVEADAVSYPFDVAIITSGCEAFEACGLIEQFGGSISGCLDVAAGVVEGAESCIDELETSFGCADTATSCDFATECGTESQAVDDCKNALGGQ